MQRKVKADERRGATLVESAIVLPVTLLLLFGLIIGGMGVFRYQEVASLAREGARYALVHGGQYQQETGQPAATTQDIRNYMLSKQVALDPNQLTVAVYLNTPNGAMPWDSSSKYPYTRLPNGNAETNTVTVHVTYKWAPEALLGSPITLTSTSTMPMSY